MRVVAGIWRGRRFAPVPGDATRPTTDRVRESLFAVIGERLAGRETLDLFCGAGGLGLEALSRGAARTVFVDHAAAAVRTVRRNLASLAAEPSRWRVVRAEALAWAARRLAEPGDPVWILADPPYGHPAAARLAELAAGHRERVAGLVVEHPPGAGPDPAVGWRCDRRRYGRTEISILEPTS